MDLISSFMKENESLLDLIRSKDSYTLSSNGVECDESTMNLIAISDTMGGLSGPSKLYEKMVESPYDGVLLARVDIACPSDGKRFLLPPSQHFEYAVHRVQEVARSLFTFNHQPVVLMGWSMGGAVVIEAAYRLQHEISICGIITLCSQGKQTDHLKDLQPHMFKCFLHGSSDNNLPSSISDKLYDDAPFFLNKESWCIKHILPNGDHSLSQYTEHIHYYLHDVIKHIKLLFDAIKKLQSN